MTVTAAKRQPEEQYYRLTLLDAIAKYERNDITAKGLVHFYLLIKLKAGWTRRIDQKKVCKELGISKAAFYSAISRLKADNEINWEAPDGIVVSLSTSRIVCERGQESISVDSESISVDSESISVDSESISVDSKAPKPLSTENYGDSPDLYSSSSQLTTSVSHYEPEREITKSREEIPRSDPQLLASLLPAIETAYEIVTDLNEDQCSAAPTKPVENYEPEFLNWVIKRVKLFPNPPIFPRQAAIALIKRSEAELCAEYEEETRAIAQRFELIAQTPVEEPADPITTNLARLSAKWNLSFRQAENRDKVIQEIESHPEWGIEIINDQLQLTN